jgi:predicted nucleic acid-binding protein
LITAADTNILLDVLISGSPDAAASSEQLKAALSRGSVAICEAVYAELAAGFDSQQEVADFLNEVGVHLQISSPATLYRAA